jgi:hypothetical protein
MEKSKALSDKEKCEILVKEIEEFKKLMKGHEKLLAAIGKL